MGFFNDLKLKKDKNGNIKVTYKTKPFISINSNTVYQVINDYATKAFITKITKLVAIDDVDSDIVQEAVSFEKTYTKMKRQFYGRKNINNIKTNTQQFKDIIKAVELANRMDIGDVDFINAHIDGLSFVNDGKGTFPTTKQLHGEKAELRILNFLHTDENSSNFVPEKLTYSDKNTPVMENPKFVRYYKKIQEGKATLKEATFCHDCLMSVRGKGSKLVSNYIESFDE